LVYDPFVGSGTTIIAAEMTARRCYAIEIDPAYVQVAIERWQTFTGKQATLEGDSRSFEAIKRERVVAGAPSQ
jgi:DNA modification methylase